MKTGNKKYSIRKHPHTSGRNAYYFIHYKNWNGAFWKRKKLNVDVS